VEEEVEVEEGEIKEEEEKSGKLWVNEFEV
jgi:hypothetical protein